MESESEGGRQEMGGWWGERESVRERACAGEREGC